MILVDRLGRMTSDSSLEELKTIADTLGYKGSMFVDSNIPHYRVPYQDIQKIVYYGGTKASPKQVLQAAKTLGGLVNV